MIRGELLFSITKKDLKIDYFSGHGAGGQHRNKHQNCVRLHHMDSGTLVTGQSNKSRQANLKEAFQNLVKDGHFKIWHARRVQEILRGETIEEKVEGMLRPQNLKIEFQNIDGSWDEEGLIWEENLN